MNHTPSWFRQFPVAGWLLFLLCGPHPLNAQPSAGPTTAAGHGGAARLSAGRLAAGATSGQSSVVRVSAQQPPDVRPSADRPSTLYAAVVATKLFVVGAANPQTGLFFRRTEGDTAWSHSGPNTIRAFGIALDPHTDGTTMYIAAGNGLHRSTDAGRSWKITTGWDITEVLWVSPDPHHPGTVYIATPYGVYRTTDGCRTWVKRSRGLATAFVSCVIVDRVTPDVVYSATEGGAVMSRDGGASWQRMGLSVGGVRVIVQHPVNPGILAAGTEEHGIYITKDGGKIWTRSEAGLDHKTFYTIVFDPTNPDVMYAGGYVTGVYRTTNGGGRWARVNDCLDTPTIHSIAVDPRDGNRVYAGAYWGGVYVTEDGGKHWSFSGLPESQVWHLTIGPRGGEHK